MEEWVLVSQMGQAQNLVGREGGKYPACVHIHPHNPIMRTLKSVKEIQKYFARVEGKEGTGETRLRGDK